MRSLVFLQSGTICEASRAVPALVRLFSRVDSHVRFQRGLVRKPLQANIALMRLRSSVSEFMILQGCTLGKAALTDLTRVRLLFGMAPDMAFESEGPSENSVTVRAGSVDKSF